MLNRYRNSDPFATLRSFHSLASVFDFGQLTADKRFGSCRASPKFSLRENFVYPHTLYDILLGFALTISNIKLKKSRYEFSQNRQFFLISPALGVSLKLTHKIIAAFRSRGHL